MHSFTNTKGFKIIKTSAAEVRAVGGYALCDGCNLPTSSGYLIPVLGSYWYCQKCYDDWNKYAKFYEEDVEFETQMHDNWIKIFKEKGII